jgi:hypothetical protein
MTTAIGLVETASIPSPTIHNQHNLTEKAKVAKGST